MYMPMNWLVWVLIDKVPVQLLPLTVMGVGVCSLSNVDPVDVACALNGLEQETTLG
jgi:hypothetical protein